jgi:hypothetical protein
LATTILVLHHCNSEEQKLDVLNRNTGEAEDLKEILGIDSITRKDLSESDKLKEWLINQSFYQEGIINRKGMQSLVRYGFYKPEEFENEFSNWSANIIFFEYIDNYKNHLRLQSDDEEAIKFIFEKAKSIVFVSKEILCPDLLFRYAIRVSCDIKSGIVNLKQQTFEKELLNLMENLYEGALMERRMIEFPFGEREFQFCRSFVKQVQELNDKYMTRMEEEELSSFWTKLKLGNISNIELKKIICSPIYAQASATEILGVLEGSTNRALAGFIQAHHERVEAGIKHDSETGEIDALVGLIKEKYNNQYGSKTSKIKWIASILETGSMERA